MKKTIVIAILICGSCFSVFGQASTQEDKEAVDRRQREEVFNGRVDQLRNVGKEVVVRERYKNTKTYQLKIKPLYRDLNGTEAELLAPEKDVNEKFGKLASSKDWGLRKLVIDRGCSEEPDIVVSTPHCIKYGMPGAGAAFSFRSNSYRLKRLADITFTKNGFETVGNLKHGILVDLGDVSLKDIELKDPKLQTLVDFQPESDFDQALMFVDQLRKGISGGEFLYGSVIPAKLDRTFALRSIAYRGSNIHTVEDISYNELDFDNRKDVIVVFRVVQIVPDESVTILWRLLDEKKSPKLEKNE